MRKITASLRAFLNGIIDYAGLYPPANLPLDQAIRNFAAYQTDAHVWMLSRFILPAKRLPELTDIAGEVFPENKTLAFSTLGRGGKTGPEFLQNLKLDIADVDSFRRAHGSGVVVDMFEAALPAVLFNDKDELRETIHASTSSLNENGLKPFFEAPFDSDWIPRVNLLMDVLGDEKNASFKARTGGVTPEAFPTLGQLSAAICAARDAGKSFKATAGLHHPVRHYNPSVQTKMHGFINVFGAAAFAHALKLTPAQVESILVEENPANFTFTETGFIWKDLSISINGLNLAREQFCLSFGSCSFDEPREDLRALGLL